jgi:hypothetical protein
MVELIKIALGVALMLVLVKVAFDWLDARSKKKKGGDLPTSTSKDQIADEDS